MKILIIPEDFVKDQYMLKPIVEAMMKNKNKSAKIKVCQNPRLRGINQALKWEKIEQIIQMYPMIDLFLLCVDRDGNANRKEALLNLENQATQLLSPDKHLLAENAWQEIEVWVLAGYKSLPSDWVWNEIRMETHPKETYFIPFVEQQNMADTPGEGRKILAQEAARHYVRISQLCPEVADLESRIE